jgi:flagellar FliJ protein
VRPFRFRPQPALDLRQKQEDDARLRLAEAERAAIAAAARVDEARARVGQADDALMSTQREGSPAWLLSWHRCWIATQRVEVDARSREAAVSVAAVERASTSVRDAFQRRRTLERLRDRLRERHSAEVIRHERREMDMLAGMRHLTHAADQKIEGGTHGEHDQPDFVADSRTGPESDSRFGADD